jgi:aminocarboxymuconate-semialdehyde decarboxylase
MLIDVHCHVSPLAYPDSPSEEARTRWPCMHCSSSSDAMLMFDGKPFRKLDSRSWSSARRLDDMDADGVDVQVLSPMPELLSYWLAYDDAEKLADHVNQQISELISRSPQRFRGLGAVPLQDPGRSAQYLRRLKHEFGLSGVEIGSNVNGQMLGSPEFEPFFAAAEELSLCIFVHALHPVAAKAVGASENFAAFAGFPIDVAMAATSILLSGLIERRPKLRIGFSHGGGALGSMLGRLDMGWLKTQGFGGTLQARPSEQARRLYFDSNVYEVGYLRHIAETLAPGHVFVGTDYPYLIMQTHPAAFIAKAGLTAGTLQQVSSAAALAYLGEGER